MATEEHKELSTFIKNIHQKLRVESQKHGADEAWSVHCKQQELLKKYASSMMRLATECWESNNRGSDKCRVQWVISQAEEYFLKIGQHKAEQWENNMNNKLFGITELSAEYSCKVLNVLNVLDVGSCYNPFRVCPFFNVLALDLAPATTDVIQCDFLSAEVVSTNCSNTDIVSPCKQLPESNFDIVVFSLLLEYLPSSEQRYLCCVKAYKLLKVSGVLFILTPDSKHESANSRVMKSWRIALASIGYWRICYKKLKHLHCMIFRKCKNPAIPRHILIAKYMNCIPEKCLYIPQDFHEYTDKCEEEKNERSDTDNKIIAHCFTELPVGDTFS